MAGSDLPSGSSGSTSPPPRAAKRKRGDGSASLPSRATRSSAVARKAAAGPLRVARRVAAGALWAPKVGRGRGRGFGDVERMREVILGVRLARSVHVLVPHDHPDSPYPKERGSSRSPKKRVPIDPVEHQAFVPEWEDKPSEQETDDYKAETLPKLGTIVCPLNMDISATDEPKKTRKEWVDDCNCSHPGSEDCVRVHVNKARSWMKDQLGEVAFGNCGLDAMGEQVGELWTAIEKKKLEDVDKLIPKNEHQKFINVALKELSQKEKMDSEKCLKEAKDLAKYYYNVFLPRRFASLTRGQHKKDEAIDTDNEKSGQDDDNNEHHPRKKSKSSGSSSSTRPKKYNTRKNSVSGTTATLQRKKN